jgi:hypothetical protein
MHSTEMRITPRQLIVSSGSFLWWKVGKLDYLKVDFEHKYKDLEIFCFLS